MRHIVFWGAGGHARVLRELVERQGLRLVALFDNDPGTESPFPDVTLFHGREGFLRWRSEVRGDDIKCLAAIGGSRGADRIELQRYMIDHGLCPAIAIHETAFTAADAQIGIGSQILAHATACAAVAIGEACIINTKASIDHECRLDDGVHIAPGAILAGCVTVGRGSLIGPGAVILPRIRIGTNVIVGAGAVVTNDVPDNIVVFGNPARFVRNNPTKMS